MYVHLSKKGLSREVVESISKMKDEPQWMLDFRLRSYDIFMKKPVPQWGGDLNRIDFQNIYYYAKATEKTEKNWDDVPAEIKNTFDKLGIPEAEKKFIDEQIDVVYSSWRNANSAQSNIDKIEEFLKETRGTLDHRKLLDHLIDEQEDKFIELVEGTRSHIAVIDHYLKRLAIALDDSDAAASHFEDGLQFCRNAAYRPELAWTCSDYAELLLGSTATANREKIPKLQDEAIAITRELGMTPLLERVLAQREILKA